MNKQTVLSIAQKSLLKSTNEAERYLGLTRGSIAYLRSTNHGPSYLKQGNRFFYTKEILDAWLKSTHTFISVKK
jgi:hypothetical protein